MKIRVVDRI